MFLPIYNLVQKGSCPPVAPPMCLIGDAHLILSRNESKRNTAYIDDLIINEKNIKNAARKYQSQGGFIQNFCVNKFGVMPLCYPC
jgi:hypothetical protein